MFLLLHVLSSNQKPGPLQAKPNENISLNQWREAYAPQGCNLKEALRPTDHVCVQFFELSFLFHFFHGATACSLGACINYCMFFGSLIFLSPHGRQSGFQERLSGPWAKTFGNNWSLNALKALRLRFCCAALPGCDLSNGVVKATLTQSGAKRWQASLSCRRPSRLRVGK